MVAQSVSLPNIRTLFIPDKGYTICDADLAGADARVVAWEAEDEDLKKAFREGLKLHVKNARDVYPEVTESMTDDDLKATDKDGGLYHNCKKRVHAANYGGKPPTLAQILRTSIATETLFQDRWFGLHPGILEWHERTEYNLMHNRTVSNRFGFRYIFFDRLDNALPQALAWGPQSTVAIACTKGAMQVRNKYPWVQMLMQVHDSIVFQIPWHREGMLEQIKKDLEVEIPYPDPLVIPWGIGFSRESWGRCK